MSGAPLFKYYTERQWAERFMDGELLCRALSYFCDYEDGIRGDLNEGKSIFRPQAGLVIKNQTRGTTFTLAEGAFEADVKRDEIFVFCLSGVLSTGLARQFTAQACVEVRDRQVLCDRVKAALPAEATVFARPVDYYNVPDAVGPRWALPELIATSKVVSDDYQMQDEFRVVFSTTDALEFEKVSLRLVLGRRDRARSDTHPSLTLNVGSLSDICVLHTF